MKILKYLYLMKLIWCAAFLFFLCFTAVAGIGPAGEGVLSDGNQPQVTADVKGVLRIIYGKDDEIYYTESRDKGNTFRAPVLVGKVPGMHLGMSRGPQLASSKHYSVITAMDRPGNIHWFLLDHTTGKWKSMGLVNDQFGSAPEGLMNIAADDNDHFYAVWLDIRTGKHNQIYFSHLAPKAGKWSQNKLVYQSPDGHVCECYQPHIAVNGSEVAIMFRNWLNGSRDLYLTTSKNSGSSFSPAEKLGNDTSKLNACPMDGGGLTVTNSSIETTWQREGRIYYCKPGQPEQLIGNGRGSCIAVSGADTYVGYQSRDTLKLVSISNKKAQTIGIGEFIKSVSLPGNVLFCVWEADGKIKYKKV
jgi:hypothetical protein